MGTAMMQGSLWGARARDYADVVERMFTPVYERVFDEVVVGVGTRLLDVGCGPGLAAYLAAKRGARVSGLDAAETSVAIARERTPEGDFRVGEMLELPWADASFDVVTSFNAFQFAADPIDAMREARRVARPAGRVAVVVWGRDAECETTVTIAAVARLLPPAASGESAPLPPSAPGRVEAMLEQAGISPLASGEEECLLDFPDLETAVRGLTSAGVMVATAKRVGDDAVRKAVADSLAPFQTSAGRYRQRNRFRYVIAAT